MAARYPMCTLARKSWWAMAPPMSAAAMLSRKLDSTKTITSMTNAPFQSSGRYFGRITGTWLFSKWRERSANPMSRPKRLASVTHSCPRCVAKPIRPGPNLNPEKRILKSEMVTSPVSATPSVWAWKIATPSSVRAKRKNSMGMPKSMGAG